MNYQNHEDAIVLGLITEEKSTILDIGCGLGRYLKPLIAEGHNVIGIDKNPDIVNRLNSEGYNSVYTVDFTRKKPDISFDYLIMSHIIEHIEPKDLISFFNNYIQYLKVNGKLIISTPTLHTRFFDDYDHIRPYTPNSLKNLFSDYEQMQEKPVHRLKLNYVWLRKDPIKIEPYPGSRYRKTYVIKKLNKCLINLYKISFHLISETTGWVGQFTRVS